jgi:very-short-patch-repair endonuclease
MPGDLMPGNPSLAASAGPNSSAPGSGAANSALVIPGAASAAFSVPGGGRDAAAARIAGGQRTLLTPAQLADCGLSPDAIRHRLASGRLHVVFRGVYSMGCGVLPPLAREQAALMALGPHTFLSHRSAASVWGMRKTEPDEVEVSVLGRCCESREGIKVHRIKAIDRRGVRRHEDLWVSSPARAVLEVAAVATRDELVEVIDQGLALRRFTSRDLKNVLARNRGRRGAARLAEVIADDTAMAISRSRAEKALLRLIREAGLPLPETNVKFGQFEADFVWRKERVIVELDSATYHSGPGVFHRDREKALVFRGAGYDVLRPTRWHVVHEGPRLLVLLVQALAGGLGGL